MSDWEASKIDAERAAHLAMRQELEGRAIAAHAAFTVMLEATCDERDTARAEVERLTRERNAAMDTKESMVHSFGAATKEWKAEIARLTRERDEARERARLLADGEVITKGIARIVDEQTQTLIDKAKAAKAEVERLREFSALTLESLRLATTDVKLVEMLRSFKAQLAALAGSPVETRRLNGEHHTDDSWRTGRLSESEKKTRPAPVLPVDDEAEARFEKLLAKRVQPNAALMAALDTVAQQRADERRAFAERVREAMIDELRELLETEECDCPPEWPRCGLHRALLRLRALDLAPLLEEP